MITIPGWLAIIITLSVPVIVFAGRHWIKTFIEGKIHLDVEGRIEKVRSELRKTEELLKAELRSKEADITTLREGVLNGRANRLAIIEKRRLEAIERVWLAVTKLSRMKGPAMTLSTLKIEAVAKRAPSDAKLREFLEMISSTMGGGDFEKSIKEIRADEERPFIAEYTWALYSAYSAVIIGGYTMMKILSIGIEEPDKLIKRDHVSNLLKLALPHQTEYIDQYGAGGHYHLLDELEKKLLKELKNALNGADIDRDNVTHTADLMKAVAEVTKDTQQAAAAALSAR